MKNLISRNELVTWKWIKNTLRMRNTIKCPNTSNVSLSVRFQIMRAKRFVDILTTTNFN